MTTLTNKFPHEIRQPLFIATNETIHTNRDRHSALKIRIENHYIEKESVNGKIIEKMSCNLKRHLHIPVCDDL